MNTYPQVPLGEICTVNPRKKEPKCLVEGAVVSFVPMAAVDERFGAIAVLEERLLSDVSRGFTAFENGDVLFAKITPCMENGKIALARNLTNGVGRGSTEFFVLRPGDRVLGEYVCHFVRQPRFREEAKKSFTGTAGQQRVPKSFMENVLVALPPFSAQRKIVGILDRAIRIEHLRTQAADRLGGFMSALFFKVFGDHDQIGKRFPCIPLREVATIRSGITKGRKINPANAIEVPYLRVANVQDGFLNLDEIKTITIKRGEEEKYELVSGDLVMTEGGDPDKLNPANAIEVPYLRVANVQDGFLNLDEIKTITIKRGEEEKYELVSGDLVMTEGGDPDKLGRAAIWNGELAYCAHQNHIFRVRPYTEILLTDYLREAAGSAYGKAYFLSVAKQTTGIASINKTQLGDFPVPIPPIDLQTRYAKIVASVYGIATAAHTASNTVSILSLSLMPHLLGD